MLASDDALSGADTPAADYAGAAMNRELQLLLQLLFAILNHELV